MRVYLEKGQRVSRAPKGGAMVYSAGHYNVDDVLADMWVKSGAAFPVDTNDEPIRESKLRARVFSWSSSKGEEE